MTTGDEQIEAEMATDWTISWRKLYRNPSGSWLRLPVSARGLGSELLRYAEDDGFLIDCEDEDPAMTIAFMLGSRPKEHKRIAEDVALLLKDGYLVQDGTKLRIKNFAIAQQSQESSSASRMRRLRERQKEKQNGVTRDVTSDDHHHVTTNHDQTSHTTVTGDTTSDTSPPSQAVTSQSDGREEKRREEKTRQDPDPEKARSLSGALARVGEPESGAQKLSAAWCSARLPPGGIANAYEREMLETLLGSTRALDPELPSDEALCLAWRSLVDGFEGIGVLMPPTPAKMREHLGWVDELARGKKTVAEITRRRATNGHGHERPPPPPRPTSDDPGYRTWLADQTARTAAKGDK